MSEQTTDRFPRRDDQGRIMFLPDLIGSALGGLVIGLLVLILFDWAFDLIGLGSFGGANGWLALILPAWLFIEDFRAWDRGPVRIAAALVAAAVGLTLGLAVAGLVNVLPALWTGVIGAAVTVLTYALIWFVGVRWLDSRTG